MQEELDRTIAKLEQYPLKLQVKEMVRVNSCCYMPVTLLHTN
jgi:hypothetical protein